MARRRAALCIFNDAQLVKCKATLDSSTNAQRSQSHQFSCGARRRPDSGSTVSKFMFLSRSQVCVSIQIGAICCLWHLLWASFFFFYTALLAHICQTCLPRGIACVKTGVVGFLARVDFPAGERDRSLPDKRSHSGAVCYCAARLRAALIKANSPATRTTEGKSEDELLLLPSVHAPTICKFMTPE